MFVRREQVSVHVILDNMTVRLVSWSHVFRRHVQFKLLSNHGRLLELIYEGDAEPQSPSSTTFANQIVGGKEGNLGYIIRSKARHRSGWTFCVVCWAVDEFQLPVARSLSGGWTLLWAAKSGSIFRFIQIVMARTTQRRAVQKHGGTYLRPQGNNKLATTDNSSLPVAGLAILYLPSQSGDVFELPVSQPSVQGNHKTPSCRKQQQLKDARIDNRKILHRDNDNLLSPALQCKGQFTILANTGPPLPSSGLIEVRGSPRHRRLRLPEQRPKRISEDFKTDGLLYKQGKLQDRNFDSTWPSRFPWSSPDTVSGVYKLSLCVEKPIFRQVAAEYMRLKVLVALKTGRDI
ncbi:hypothetical protein GALMADRAFT_207401 [Galerina marginata CBS 339.88]|uniref:Uncharacterized protein n=1 Tax=Galerina marginata (strain CBS 339.88) TaxID=685588 RepID=A0A067TSX0_GALM3|nr:hypothetical protein GALMADRAFT_207401 [Galerina marginata CBS 339.88]